MDRIRDYACFVVWFGGIGYLGMWPFSAVGESALPFGASLICAGDSGFLAQFCALPHPLRMPPGLHALGAVLTVILVGRSCLRAWKTIGARRGRRTKMMVATRLDVQPLPPPPLNLPSVKPRTHFGLRGVTR